MCRDILFYANNCCYFIVFRTSDDNRLFTNLKHTPTHSPVRALCKQGLVFTIHTSDDGGKHENSPFTVRTKPTPENINQNSHRVNYIYYSHCWTVFTEEIRPRYWFTRSIGKIHEFYTITGRVRSALHCFSRVETILIEFCIRIILNNEISHN